MNNKFNIESAKEISINAVRGAGEIIRKNLEKEKNISFKGRSDIATDVDLKSEKFIIDLIENKFPDHSILSEEKGYLNKKSEYIWVIDPIDGTINYYHGVEPFCVALCLLKKDEIIISSIYNPLKDHLYFAQKDKGATLNERAIRVSSRNLKNAVVMTHISSKKEARDKLIPHIEEIFSKSMHIRVFGSGISTMAYVAAGNFDVFFNIETNAWDILPATLLIQEAGGRVTDIKGDKINIKSTSVLATNGIAHDEMLNLLKTF